MYLLQRAYCYRINVEIISMHVNLKYEFAEEFVPCDLTRELHRELNIFLPIHGAAHKPPADHNNDRSHYELIAAKFLE